MISVTSSQATTISKATEEHIPILLQLVNGAYRGENSRAGWTTEADLLDGIRTDELSLQAMLQHPDAAILICSNEADEICGCVYLEKKEPSLYLGMLSVSPLLQAKGIGKILLYAAEAYGREMKCKQVSMTVISVRKELIDWYERHGYQKTGETEPFPKGEKFGIPRQPLEFVVLEKLL